MNEFDWVIYAILQQYVKDSLDGVGALKGAPLVVTGKTDILNADNVKVGTRLTFQWTSNSGVVSTDSLDLRNGRGIKEFNVDSTGHLITTFDDGLNQDAGEIKLSFVSMEVVPSLPATGKESVIYLTPSNVANVYSMYVWSTTNNDWYLVGSTTVDLTNYYTKFQADNKFVVKSDIGVAGGVAGLDGSGKVPASQLPSYVDDVIEGYFNETDGKFYETNTPTYAGEIIGETGKIYISIDTSASYRWGGSLFIEISSGSGVPDGGTVGQMLVKKSIADGDAEWTTVHEELSWADYQALTSDEKNDGKIRFVPDAPEDNIGSGELTNSLSVSENVGGIKSGDSYASGTSLEDILRDMLNPVKYPALVAPSATLSATGAKLLEKGATLNTTMTISFNRGSISPTYGTSGNRAGAATGYSLNGSVPQSANSFSVTVDESETSYRGAVEYGVGEQPKDSVGNNYSTPLPAGSVNTNTITYEFVEALWANTTNIGNVDKLALVSKSTKQKEFTFPAQTVANPECFDVPASWNVTAIETLNPLSNTWGNCAGEFSVTDISHDDASGNLVAYKRYTDNRGYNAGARSVRIKWS